jgi:hypothetical protein
VDTTHTDLVPIRVDDVDVELLVMQPLPPAVVKSPGH